MLHSVHKVPNHPRRGSLQSEQNPSKSPRSNGSKQTGRRGGMQGPGEDNAGAVRRPGPARAPSASDPCGPGPTHLRALTSKRRGPIPGPSGPMPPRAVQASADPAHAGCVTGHGAVVAVQNQQRRTRWLVWDAAHGVSGDAACDASITTLDQFLAQRRRSCDAPSAQTPCAHKGRGEANSRRN